MRINPNRSMTVAFSSIATATNKGAMATPIFRVVIPRLRTIFCSRCNPKLNQNAEAARIKKKISCEATAKLPATPIKPLPYTMKLRIMRLIA